MKKFQVLVLVSIILLGLVGCEKGTVTNVATADAFIKSKVNAQGVTVYAVVHSVFSYNTMSKATVTSPGGTTTELTDYENEGISFYNKPAETDYSTTIPTIGTYTYAVTFNDGTQLTYTNSLTAATLQPAVITGLAKNANGDSIYLSWNAIPNTNAYQIKILNGTSVYTQPAFIDASVPLKANLRFGFLSSAVTTNGSGVYTFELDGYLFESSSSYEYLQAQSAATKDISL